MQTLSAYKELNRQWQAARTAWLIEWRTEDQTSEHRALVDTLQTEVENLRDKTRNARKECEALGILEPRKI
tara:strand:+ start:604 stop:816 length:213 start_codon:yes stop_codon:yes gene_type:complete